jgi:hypothetical protein
LEKEVPAGRRIDSEMFNKIPFSIPRLRHPLFKGGQVKEWIDSEGLYYKAQNFND